MGLSKNYIPFMILFVCSWTLFGQENKAITEIIEKIHLLEQNKDPKCYATANRLEDFMYGTPLSDDARTLKIDIQKAIIFHLKQKATPRARKRNATAIEEKDLIPVIEDISEYITNKNGDFLYKLTTGTIPILRKDYNQYASVSYGYRSLLSVEQDLTYFPKVDLLPFHPDALNAANDYVNLLTLVTLKIADIKARQANERIISKKLLEETWVLILNESKNKHSIATITYPEQLENTSKGTEQHNPIVKQIIAQKLSSYEKYNQVAENVFLRNIQVYFARQKWPTDLETSEKLRSYYLESLIQFSASLLQQSNLQAIQAEHPIIRVPDVQKALHLFLPTTTNSFEDVLFFPNSAAEKISIESYDLDAFRDSGFHWRILGYALEDTSSKEMRSLDPNAAEQLVEGIAQMGVLVLRLAGAYSLREGNVELTQNDIETGFIQIQKKIENYDFTGIPNVEASLPSSNTVSAINNGFHDVTALAGIDFEHKSSDWLNRLIRSYTTSYTEGAIKLAIPPAFGGAGVAAEDINNDGFVDVLLLGGFGNKLYLNSGQNTFTEYAFGSSLNSWDNTLNSYGEVRQPIIADFNNDGTQDIFISYVNQAHKLYKNLDGTTFQEVSATSNLGGENAVAGPATALDYNNDGLLDIFIGYFGNYIEGTLPTLKRDNNNGMPNKLFKNLGNFVFEEVVFTDNNDSNRGWTQALGHTDINQDGLQDIIVGNDFGVNKYYLNTPSGIFTEASTQLGTDKPSYTMNVGITDLNKDLFPDFYISNIVVMQKDEKYVSPNEDTQMKFDPKKMANIRTVEANDLFLSVTKGGTLENYQQSNTIGRGYAATGWSWDADFFDFDNDGDEDLYCLNGMNDFSVYSSENPFYFERQENSKTIIYAPSSKERNVFFVNNDGKLENKAEELGTDLNSNARSASFFDFDNDGDLDIIINNYHEKATLLENKTSNQNNFIKIKLTGSPAEKINLDAIGSSIVLNSKNHKNIWREIHSTSGYLSVHPKEQHFGLGTDSNANVEIRWSNGTVIMLENLIANQSYEISYPDIVKIRKSQD
jgi:enediyne biosynthesis protein E4